MQFGGHKEHNGPLSARRVFDCRNGELN